MRNVFGWSIVAALLLVGTAVAQQPQPRPGTQPAQPIRPGQPGQPGVVQPDAASQQNDQQVAAIIAICNRHEVESVKSALPKIKSDKVKELATAMIKDHTEAANTFTRLAGHYGTTISAPRRDGDRDEGRRDNDRSDAGAADAPRDKAATAPNNPGNRVAAPGNPTQGTTREVAQSAPNTQPAAGQPRTALRPVSGGPLNWVALHQEMSDEGLAACKKEMAKYEGNEFDKAFLGSQLGSHMKVATELKVFRRHVSNQLGAEIDNALGTVEDHIEHLRKLMDEKKDEDNK